MCDSKGVVSFGDTSFQIPDGDHHYMDIFGEVDRKMLAFPCGDKLQVVIFDRENVCINEQLHM